MADALTVRKATVQDMDEVLDFYHAMIEEMQGTDFDIRWKRDEHPSDAFLRESVECGYALIGVADDGNIACALVVDHTSAPGYELAPWRVQAPANEIGIVHSVATRPAYHGRGFARCLMQAAIESARAEGLRALQLDTFIDNVRSHGLYESIGFINHGAFPVFYGDLGTIDLDLFEYVIQ